MSREGSIAFPPTVTAVGADMRALVPWARAGVAAATAAKVAILNVRIIGRAPW